MGPALDHDGCEPGARWPWPGNGSSPHLSYYELKDEGDGDLPAGSSTNASRTRKAKRWGELCPTLRSRASPTTSRPEEEVLVDRPEVVRSITRVSGPFAWRPPSRRPWTGSRMRQNPWKSVKSRAHSRTEMQEVLRKVKTIHLPGNRKVVFKKRRAPAKALTLSAEALVNGEESGGDDLRDKPVAFVFGPENGSASEILVFEAAREAYGKGYAHLFVIGFGIEPNARILVEKCSDVVGIPADLCGGCPGSHDGRSAQESSIIPGVQCVRLAGRGDL